MNEFFLYPIAIGAAYGIHRFMTWHGQYKKRAGAVPVGDSSEYDLNEAYATTTAPDYSLRVREIVQKCHKDLRGQGAAGYGPWLSSLLKGSSLSIFHDEKGGVRVLSGGRPIAPAVALTAVRWTLRELSGSRFSTKALEEAAGELEEIAWE